MVQAYRDAPGMNQEIAGRRRRQASAWMWNEIDETLMARLHGDPRAKDRVATQERAVASGETTPGEAARAVLAAFLNKG